MFAGAINKEGMLKAGLTVWLLSFVLAIFFIHYSQAPVAFDAESYRNHARTISQHGFSLGAADPRWIQEPFYPWFLAAVYSLGGGDQTARYLQAAIFASAACLLCLMAGRIYGPRAGWIAGLLYGLCPQLRQLYRIPAH